MGVITLNPKFLIVLTLALAISTATLAFGQGELLAIADRPLELVAEPLIPARITEFVVAAPEYQELPIYEIGGQKASQEVTYRLAGEVFGFDGKMEETRESYVIEADGKSLEVYKDSGGIWFADEKQLWNPESKASLPDDKAAREVVDNLLASHKWLLPSKGVLSTEYLGTTGTQMATFNADNGRRVDRQLDVQVSYGLRAQGEGFALPVTGGGAKINVVLGDGGQVIGYAGPSPGLMTDMVGMFPMITKDEADQTFKEMTEGLKLAEYESNLAYYLGPNTGEQSYLAPVYVYSGMIVLGDQKAPLRNVFIPAVAEMEFYPEIPPFKKPPLQKRGADEKVEKDRSDVDEGPVGELLIGELASPILTIKASWKEAGAYYYTLGYQNAKGFNDALSAAGWTIDFLWGDGLAWERDWNENDDTWVDDEDIVFYTGHANVNEWLLHTPDDGSLHYTECGGNDRWGNQDLEWIIIAACGPLEDELINPHGGGDVFRWKPAFSGLHQLLGYASVTFDNNDEGKRVVQYMRDGDTVIDSWFRAAKEIQPSSNGWAPPYGPEVWVGAMYAYKSGTTSPYNDHLWGYGSVAPDPINPNVYVAMWSRC